MTPHFRRSVDQSVVNSYKGGQLHFHAPIGALVFIFSNLVDCHLERFWLAVVVG